jgi:hypothetical protein
MGSFKRFHSNTEMLGLVTLFQVIQILQITYSMLNGLQLLTKLMPIILIFWDMPNELFVLISSVHQYQLNIKNNSSLFCMKASKNALILYLHWF